MRFKEFINYQEAITSSADIAGFSRITLPLVCRIWPSEVETLYPDMYQQEDTGRNKKKPYRVPQLED